MKKIRVSALLLAAGMLLGACGQESTIPELIEPVAQTGYFLPAEKARIGDVYTIPGIVEPVSYGQFFTGATTVSEIFVEVGDRVEAGQLLARADVEAVSQQLDTLRRDQEYEEASWQISKELSWLQIHMTELSGGSTAVQWENRDYDQKLHEYRMGKLQDAIDELTELVEDGTLTADHAGRVTYIKDLGAGTMASAFENIVVIADEEERYIRTDVTLDNYHYKDYEEKFFYYNGEKTKVQELSYSGEEQILSQASGSYPYLRFACPEGCSLEIGENCPLFFIRKNWEETTVVGAEALVRSEGKYYVYVQNETGKERREVTLGERDRHFAQILSGIEEGEMIYYESSLLPPAEYEEITLEKEDFELINHSDTWDYGYKKTDVYEIPYDGRVEQLFVEKGQEIEEGQLLYTLRTDNRSAALTDAQSAITKEEQSYEAKYKELGKQLSDAKNIPGEIGSAMRQIYVDQRKLLTLRHEYVMQELTDRCDSLTENNDGEGLISVYAKEAGTVRLVDVRPGQTADIEVSAGKPFVVTTSGQPDKLFFWLKDSDYVVVYTHFTGKLWNDVHLEGRNLLSPADKSGMSTDEVKEAEAVTLVMDGSCSAVELSDNAAKVPYLRTVEEKPVLTYSLPTARQLEGFALEVGDDFDWETMPKHLEASFSCFALKDVIVIPEKAVYKEKDSAGIPTGNYYVWVKRGDRLVQQFVLVDMEHVNYKEVAVLYGLQEGDILAY